MCPATKDMSCINKKKNLGGERCSIQMPVFNHHLCSTWRGSEEPERKRARLLKVDGDLSLALCFTAASYLKFFKIRLVFIITLPTFPHVELKEET